MRCAEEFFSLKPCFAQAQAQFFHIFRTFKIIMDIVSTSWTAFSRFMAANGREILTSVAVLTSGCFLSAILYFLYRFMGIIHWRKALNWRNWTLKNLLRSEKNENDEDDDDDEGEDDDDDEDEGDEEADDEENDDDDDEDRRNRHSEAMEAISKLSDEDIKAIAMMIAQERMRERCKAHCRNQPSEGKKP